MTKTDILLIEDVAADVKLISIALQNAVPGLGVGLRVARDGEAGMCELLRKRPDLLLLDLNVPKKNGLEILESIRSTPSLRTLPVVVLTNSTSPKDVESAYGACCNAYVRKPVGYDKLLAAMSAIRSFWVDLVVFPASP